MYFSEIGGSQQISQPMVDVRVVRYPLTIDLFSLIMVHNGKQLRFGRVINCNFVVSVYLFCYFVVVTLCL